MKRSVILTIFLFLTFFSDYKSSNSETCMNLCPGINWQTYGSTPFSYGGCSLIAHWRYRYINCITPAWCEFQLLRIEYVSGTTPCGGRDQHDIYNRSQEAMRAILLANGYSTPCGAGLTPGDCSVQFSITESACWHFEEPIGPFGNNESLGYCKMKPVCCWGNWKICLDEKGQPYVEKYYDISLNPICPYDNDTSACFAICEYDNPPIQKPSDIIENIDKFTGYKAGLYPNPSSGFINISLKAVNNGEHSVDIFDLSGNLIYSKTIIKDTEEVLILLDMSKLSNGSYYYFITQNNIPKISGSFNIVK